MCHTTVISFLLKTLQGFFSYNISASTDGSAQVSGKFDPSHPENYLSDIWNPLKYLSYQGLVSRCGVALLLYSILQSEMKAAVHWNLSSPLPLLFILLNHYLISCRRTFELNMWWSRLTCFMCTVCFLIKAGVNVVAMSSLCTSIVHVSMERLMVQTVALSLPLIRTSSLTHIHMAFHFRIYLSLFCKTEWQIMAWKQRMVCIKLQSFFLHIKL